MLYIKRSNCLWSVCLRINLNLWRLSLNACAPFKKCIANEVVAEERR